MVIGKTGFFGTFYEKTGISALHRKTAGGFRGSVLPVFLREGKKRVFFVFHPAVDHGRKKKILHSADLLAGKTDGKEIPAVDGKIGDPVGGV